MSDGRAYLEARVRQVCDTESRARPRWTLQDVTAFRALWRDPVLSGQEPTAPRARLPQQNPTVRRAPLCVCRRCRQIVPMDAVREVAVEHYPENAEDGHYGRRDYFCVGSGQPPGYPAKATTITILWDEELPRDEVLRLSRAWAAKISEKPVVQEARIQTYGTVRRGSVA